MKSLFISAIYESAYDVFNTKEEAIENAWACDENNVTEVVKKDELLKLIGNSKTLDELLEKINE